MVKTHIKRISAPKSWPILRKAHTWVTRPKPGRSFNEAIALSNVLKELTGVATTSKEVRFLLRSVGVLVNGKRVYDARRPVGLFDTVSVPAQKAHFRISLNKQAKLYALAIDEKEANLRVVKITGKTRRSNAMQLNGNDSSNFLVTKDEYAIGDSLLVSGSEIKKHLPMTQKAQVMLVSGSHLGGTGEVVSVSEAELVFIDDSGEQRTARKCAFVIAPEVTVQ